jgi:hypothetical protein
MSFEDERRRILTLKQAESLEGELPLSKGVIVFLK